MKKLFLIPLVVSMAVSPSRVSASALQWNKSCADRPFLGFSLIGESFKGDLNGKLVLGNPDKAFYIPRLDPFVGFSVSYGRTRKNGLWSISYSMTPHKASFQGRTSHSISHVLDVSGKGFLFSRAVLRPYVHLGFDLAWLHVGAGALKGAVVSDANYLGLGVHAGMGVIAPLNSKIFLGAGAVYRFLAYLYAKGPGRGRDVTNLNIDRYGPRRDIFLKAPGLRVEINLGYLF